MKCSLMSIRFNFQKKLYYSYYTSESFFLHSKLKIIASTHDKENII